MAYLAGPPNNAGFRATETIFVDTVQVQADFPYENNVAPYVAPPLSLSATVDQTIGGIGTPGTLLGFSDGMLSVAQKWMRLSGLVISPPKTAELRASQPYGNVGLNNRAQNLLLGTQYQAIPDLLPDAATIAKSYTSRGGI